MREFKKTLTVAAALSTFLGGGIVGLQGVSSILDSRVHASLVQRGLVDSEESTTVVDTVTTGVKKALVQALK